MDEYIVQKATLIALADEVRELSGTNTLKSIDAMTSDVDAANTEIAEQTELLEQIVTALEGKVAGGGELELQDKTITPTTNKQVVTADNGYDGLNEVTVEAIPSNYEDVGTETTEYTSLNTELEAVINSLPSASGGSDGGNIEVWTGTLHGGSGLGDIPDRTYYYIDETATFQNITLSRGDSAVIAILAHSPIMEMDFMYGE